MMIELGQYLELVPVTYECNKSMQKHPCEVVYINYKHKYFTVFFKDLGFKESFKMLIPSDIPVVDPMDNRPLNYSQYRKVAEKWQ